MRHLGIDYGSKRVGVAFSDEGGEIAFPHSVLQNNEKLIPTLAAICADKQVGAIVVGDSRTLSGEPNAITPAIEHFTKELAAAIGLPIYAEPEFYTSAHAARAGGKHAKLDASAAALILQSFLDRKQAGV